MQITTPARLANYLPYIVADYNLNANHNRIQPYYYLRYIVADYNLNANHNWLRL